MLCIQLYPPTLLCCTRRYNIKRIIWVDTNPNPLQRSGYSNTEGSHVKTGETTIQKLERELSEDSNPTNNLILDFDSPELGAGENFCYLSYPVYNTFILKTYFYLILYMHVLPAYIFVHHMGVQYPWMPWDSSFRQLSADMWVLGIKLIRFSGREASEYA